MKYDHAQAQDRFPKGHLKFTILVDPWSSLLYAQFSDLCFGVKKSTISDDKRNTQNNKWFKIFLF